MQPDRSKRGLLPHGARHLFRCVCRRVTERRPEMHALPKVTNPLRPKVHRSWIPPIRFRTKPYLRLSQSLSEALHELEVRYPSHRRTAVQAVAEERMTQRL